MLGGQLPGRAAVDGLSVELGAEAQHQARAIGHLHGEPHVCCGLADRLSQLGCIDANLRWRVVLAGSIQPDQSVKMHDTAALEFRDFDKRHPAASGEFGRGQARCLGECATEVDGKSAP